MKTTDDKKIDAYFKSKEEIDAIRSDMTLLKWEVLSKANKLGKDIWGKKFTILKLSKDMGIPFTTVQRCLALDRATAKSWELIKRKKISSFKVAMVCQLKSHKLQDEIIAVAIKDNLSTCQLKKFRPKNIQDINTWRHESAVKKGYSRQESAYRNLNTWIQRGFIFLLMPISAIGPKYKEEILDKLVKLHSKLGAYLKKNGR